MKMKRYKGPVHLYHIHKTGGRSLIFTFLSAFVDDPQLAWNKICSGQRDFGGLDFYGDYDKESDFSWSHRQCFVHPNPYAYTISIFRDPIERIASYYRMLELECRMLELQKTPYWDCLGHGFMYFLRNMPKDQLFEQLAMFSPSLSVEEAYYTILRNVNCVFRTENFNEIVPKICMLLGLENSKAHHVTGRREYQESLDQWICEELDVALELNHDQLLEFYEDEYKLLDLLGEYPFFSIRKGK